MSWRIENTPNPLTVLGELPDGLAQTCIAWPASWMSVERVLAILGEVHRVLRPDGTLWFHQPASGEELALSELHHQGWRPQQPPLSSSPFNREDVWGMLLFSKQPTHYLDPLAATACAHGRRRSENAGSGGLPVLGGRARRRQRRGVNCAAERQRRTLLLRRCILASTSPVACGVCGAPHRRIPNTTGRWFSQTRRPTCTHSDCTGRCLVLDPFYRPAIPTGTATRLTHRGFLAINDTSPRGKNGSR